MFDDAKTLSEISQILGVPVSRLKRWADQEDDQRYDRRVVGNHKRKPRVVADPKPELKQISKALHADFTQRTRVLKYAHGFVKGHGARSNAKVHRNQRLVWKVDILQAFQSVPRSEVERLLRQTYSKQLAEVFSGWVCRDGWLVPGNPASPAIFNAYCVTLTVVLAYLARRYDLKFSAYADDFYFSGNEIGPKFRSIVVNTLSKWGFKAHEFGTPKNRLMAQGKDQVIITGLRLTQDGEVRLPRKVYGEGTRLIKQLKSAPYPTERVWLAEVDVDTGTPAYGSHLIERDPNSVIGFLKYCYENDSGFQAWAENQLAAPEYAHILGKITGKQISEHQEVSSKEQKPKPSKARVEVKAKIIPDKQDLPPTSEVQEGMPISDLLRVWDLEKILNVSRSTIYRKERKGEFPRRVRIGDNSVAWKEDEVRAWLAERPRGMA